MPHVQDFGLVIDNNFTSLVPIPFLQKQKSVSYWKNHYIWFGWSLLLHFTLLHTPTIERNRYTIPAWPIQVSDPTDWIRNNSSWTNERTSQSFYQNYEKRGTVFVRDIGVKDHVNLKLPKSIFPPTWASLRMKAAKRKVEMKKGES